MSDYESHQDDDELDGTSEDLPAPDAEEEEDEGGSAAAATATSDQFTEKPDDSEIEQIERERAERLDDANRPDGVEIDNTDRTFDAEKGMFTDSEGYDEAEAKFPAPGDQGA